jgi:hypothetical protein
MTIRRKIQLGVAVILVMFAGLSGFAINQMTVMSRHFSGLTEKVIPTLGLSAQISLVLDKLRVTQAYQVLEQNSQQANVLQMDVVKLQGRMYKLVEQYREVITDPAQQSALDFLANDFNAYMESWDSLRVGTRSNLAGEALEVLRSSAPIHARLRSRVADLDNLTRDLRGQGGRGERGSRRRRAHRRDRRGRRADHHAGRPDRAVQPGHPDADAPADRHHRPAGRRRPRLGHSAGGAP